MKIFNRQKGEKNIMGLVPLMIQQGGTVSSFIITTMKTKPLGMIVLFTIADFGLKGWLTAKGKKMSQNWTYAGGVLLATIITGPFIIEWAESSFNYVNDKIVDLSDDFFNFTSALGA
jgi:hypothetical protein